MNEKEFRDLQEEVQKTRIEIAEVSKKFSALEEFVKNSLGEAGGSIYLGGVDAFYRQDILRELSPRKEVM